jgi:raffinose/stachyose/melibiose transport system permease protein
VDVDTREAPVALTPPAARISKRRARRASAPPGQPRWIAFAYLAPGLAVYSVFVLYPLGRTVWISLHEWDGLTRPSWLGLDNYRHIVTDHETLSAFGHSLILVIFYSFLPVALGIIVAVLLTRTPMRGMSLFRTVYFLPMVIATAVVAVTWSWIYEPDGPLNEGLRAIGLGSLSRAWLGDFSAALPALGVVGTWTHFGFVMMACIAGIQRIPGELYDAARIDGAGWWSEVRAVTLPGLRNQVVVVVVLTMVAALRTFDLVYIATKGGPGTTTRTPALDVYEDAFLNGQVGMASAIAVSLALVIFLATYLITKLGERREA